METGARLAAYLSGDLDPEEHTAVEAELARDPALRARLEQIRAADRALADLPEVELPEDAQDRLRRVVGRELDTVLGDELAARRARRALPRWVPAAAAAAALVVVVGGGVALTGSLSGGEDSDMAAEDTAESMDGGEAATEASGDDSGEAQVGPRVVAQGRTLDDRALRQLVADPRVLDALGTDEVDDPVATAESYARALGADTDAYFGGAGDQHDFAEEASEPAGGPEDEAAITTRGAIPPIVSRGEVSEADRADVTECLPVLQEAASAPVVPLYAELGTDADGAEVIAYAALAPDEDGDYQRVEVWLVDRSSCSVRAFMQRDR